MKAPPDTPDIPAFKMRLAQKSARMEQILAEYIADIRNVGFADQRLCAMAHSKFEEGWLLLGKALRINPVDPNEYGKVMPDIPIPREFTPHKVDDRRFGADFDDHGHLKDNG
jgi:hypothetical protein